LPSPPFITGHLGDVTVEHVAHHLPIIVRDFLREANEATHAGNYTPESISDLFTKAILAFDDAIAHDVLDLFGGSVDNLVNYTDAEIQDTINDQHEGGENWRKARLCMYGTTALVALVDPDHKDLWVANLGDCQASEFSRILTCVFLSNAHMSTREDLLFLFFFIYAVIGCNFFC
jgi:pyruvate dehydrogenase phosphatase